MANTYYIDPIAGNNANSGLIGFPKQTLVGLGSAPAITPDNGDVYILVNSGAHELPLSANEYSITKNVTIRGGTALGANATTTISSTSDSTVRRYVEVAAASTITFQNIIFDFTATTTDADAYDVVRYNGSTSLVLFEGCEFLFTSIGGTYSGVRRIFNQVSNPGTGVDSIKFRRCYFQNPITSPFLLNAVTDNIWEECVAIFGTTGFTFIARALAAGTGGETTFTNCTLYADTGSNTMGSFLVLNHNGTTFGASTHSNIVYANSSSASTLIAFMRDSSGPNTVTGTRGFNVLIGGVDVADLADIYSNGWYEKSWDANQNDATGLDEYATDHVGYAVAASTLFNAPDSSYAWSTVNGQTITLPKDLRPRLYQTASSIGGVVGALPPALTDYSAILTTNIIAPFPNDTIIITMTAANTGTAATNTIFTCLIPAGLSLVNTVASQGSYIAGTGIWTVGDIASGVSKTLTLTCTVDADQAGNSIDISASWTSGDPATDSDSTNNTDLLTINVQVDDDTDPSTIPYLDVAPIYAEVLRAEVNASIYTKRNRLRQNEVRQDYDAIWREYTSRRITIAPSTTIQIISGIERASYLLTESTGDVQVSLSLGDTTQFFPSSRRLAVLAGDFSVIKLSNPSASVSVDILIVVID